MRKLVTLTLAALCITLSCFAEKYTETYFSAKQIKDDLHFLSEKVISMHPLFTDELRKEDWQLKLDSLSKNLPDSISINNSFVLFSKLLSHLEDSHTGFSFPFEERGKYMFDKGVTMPFTVCVKNNKLFVDQFFPENSSRSVAGSQILSINNISSEKLLKDVRALAGTKNSECGDQSVEKLFGMSYWFLYGEATEYELQLSGVDSILKVQSVSNNKYFELKKKYYPQVPQKSNEINFYNNNTCAILSIKSFYDDKKLGAFLAQAFDSIAANKCHNLIIDVRDNPGGRSRSVDSLMNYLTDQHYSQYASIGIRISDEIKSHYQKKKPQSYKLIANSPKNTTYFINDSLLKHIPTPKKSFFNGNLFILVNERTNSAASTFAGLIKEKQLGKIVGRKPTGGTIRYYGDFLAFKLPNTKLEFVVSPKTFVQYGGKDLNNGVMPDIVIKNDGDILNTITKLHSSLQ
jgi:hypothetical protein